MAKKKTNKKILIIIGVIAILLFMRAKAPITKIETDTPVSIDFRVRSGDILQAVVSGEYVANARGQFGVAVGNTKPIPIQDVTFLSKSDAYAGSPFGTATFPFTVVSNLAAGAASSSVDTSWFDLEWYATNYPGITRFTFNFDYDFVDAEGNLQSNIPINGYADIEIIGDRCADTTLVDTCNGNGELCSYSAGSLILTPTSACCSFAGGYWDGTNCIFECGGISLGGCDTSPSSLPTRLTYCDPSTATMRQKCINCHCYDYYGNTEASCSGDTCVFQTYAEAVTVTVTGTSGGPALDKAIAHFTSEPSGATIFFGTVYIGQVTPHTMEKTVHIIQTVTYKLNGYVYATFPVDINIGEEKTYHQVLIPTT